MASRQDVDYTVVLVFPGFGAERENAETIVESALHWLNTYQLPILCPIFRGDGEIVWRWNPGRV